MGNYKAYFALSAIFGLLALTIILKAILLQDPGQFFLIGLVQIPLGLMQWVVGGRLAAISANYPAWVKKQVGNYWILTGSYFVGLLIVRYALTYFWPAWLIWLYVVPWTIAAYQFSLVWRMGALRKRQLQKRELLQLFNH
ncbi:MAG: hypothetical protein HEP71_21555 [Roseivirga sp.]|nr:hypothetical protein [Roseivirga sp.]